jgi:hypothetical protein
MEFLNPTSFIVATTLTIELPSGSKPGDGTGFKFKASPDSKFSNTGWETTANRTYTFQANNANVTLDPVIPNITALKGPLTSDVKVLFQIHLPDGAENRYDHSLIPLDKVEFAILKGADKSMGSWQGNWTITDTVATDSLCVILNDKGINGDKVAGDHIWSAWVTFKAGTEQGATPYKYGVWYPGCSSITGASGAPLDDAAPSGQDMSYMIKQSSQPLEELDIWPTVVTSVRSLNGVVAKEYKLNQNYPNPFNPETTIRYSLKHAGLTQVEVYNILGEKVVTLVNGVQNAGTYEVKFSGNNLPSGIYFYSINTSEYRATKKMLLLK